ncbi:MAG: NIPSNAP family protein [Cyclobacteriaceae bacterium]|nr:NIPSNAP family protein [Cyclobacteriaceae bacterium]
MKKFSVLMLFCLSFAALAQNKDSRYFEMRTYHCAENKRPDLIKRFQDHTLRLFKKNGIESIGYFLPIDTSNYTLTFILAYPDKASRDVLWNKFANDPEWQAAYKNSEANGPLVSKVDQVFMNVAPELSPKIKASKSKDERVFELRTYYCFPGKINDINARFRDHTRKLFEKHGMTNVAYWYSVESDESQPKLVYLLAHKSQAVGKESFKTFVNDPEWIKVRDASEANGKIVEKIESVYFNALDFSPIK